MGMGGGGGGGRGGRGGYDRGGRGGGRGGPPSHGVGGGSASLTTLDRGQIIKLNKLLRNAKFKVNHRSVASTPGAGKILEAHELTR